MDGGSPRELTPEAMPIFREGVYLVLSRWSALQMAVENEWGGRDSHRKADQLASDIISWFTQSRALMSISCMVFVRYLTTQIAYKLMTMHEECLEGNFQSIEGLREASRQEVAVNHVRQVVNDDDDDSDSDNDVVGNENSSNMILDAPDSSSNLNLVEMPVDDSGPKVASETDGWVQVSRRRNRGK